MPSADRPLRILTVTHNYPRFAGDPAGAFVARIAEGMAARGHAVEVITPHAPGTATTESSGGVRLHRFRYAPELLERVAYTGSLHQRTLFSPLAGVAFPGFLLAFTRAVRTAARRLQPDLIHAHWWFPGGWVASRTSLPLVMTCHGSDVRLLEKAKLVRRAGRRVFRTAAQVTTVSQFLARDIERLIPGSVPELVVTPMPVDVTRFSEGSTTVKVAPPRILYAGNLVPTKGVDVLLRATAELGRRGVDHQLKILGQGSAQTELQALARDLGVASRVTWSSFVPQSRMPFEYGASTVTVLPTRGRAEGLGLTLVEALLAGSAVVGTPAGGIPEVVRHEETGLLARDGDPTDLANQIERLLADPPLRNRLTGAGKEYVVKTYSPESTLHRFLEIYRAVTEHKPHD
jgi:glycosyltransferase involved in cell wall biosynthesis